MRTMEYAEFLNRLGIRIWPRFTFHSISLHDPSRSKKWIFGPGVFMQCGENSILIVYLDIS